MPVRRIRKKFERWREEPQEVRLRIATLLTAGSGIVIAIVWLFILLPLQLMLTRPVGSDEVGEELQAVVESVQNGQVAGATTTPTPTPEVEYYHGTRPTRSGD